jgi:hypothetical protein
MIPWATLKLSLVYSTNLCDDNQEPKQSVEFVRVRDSYGWQKRGSRRGEMKAQDGVGTWTTTLMSIEESSPKIMPALVAKDRTGA